MVVDIVETEEIVDRSCFEGAWLRQIELIRPIRCIWKCAVVEFFGPEGIDHWRHFLA